MMTQVSTGPPTITTHPTSQLTTVYMSVTLNCEGTGRGSITYQWQTKNNNGEQWSDISNSNNRRFVVRNLQESQQYRCVVSNEAGGTRSSVAVVAVLSKFTKLIVFCCSRVGGCTLGGCKVLSLYIILLTKFLPLSPSFIVKQVLKKLTEFFS